MRGRQPLANPLCPLCGGANACAPAQCGRFDVACWCTTATIPTALLDRVPDAQRGLACICAGCVAAHAAEASGAAMRPASGSA